MSKRRGSFRASRDAISTRACLAVIRPMTSDGRRDGDRALPEAPSDSPRDAGVVRSPIRTPPGGTWIVSASRSTLLSESGVAIRPANPARPANDRTVMSGSTSVRPLCRNASPVPLTSGVGKTATCRVSICTWL